MKRIETELLSVGFAIATMALFADHADPQNSTDSKRLTLSQARAESALYLDGPALDARLHRAAERWAVTDGHTTAWLDAHTGELLEVELRPSR